MKIKVNIQGFDDRESMILGLVRSEFTITQETTKDNSIINGNSYWIVYDSSKSKLKVDDK